MGLPSASHTFLCGKNALQGLLRQLRQGDAAAGMASSRHLGGRSRPFVFPGTDPAPVKDSQGAVLVLQFPARIDERGRVPRVADHPDELQYALLDQTFGDILVVLAHDGVSDGDRAGEIRHIRLAAHGQDRQHDDLFDLFVLLGQLDHPLCMAHGLEVVAADGQVGPLLQTADGYKHHAAGVLDRLLHLDPVHFVVPRALHFHGLSLLCS